MLAAVAQGLAFDTPGLSGCDMQLGFVVRDLPEAVDAWTREFGVGPFFVIDEIGRLQATHDGNPAPVVMACAFSYLGDVQIELIFQTNEAPSPYRDFLAENREGLQHIGCLTDAYDAADAGLRGAGCVERFRIAFGPGSRDAIYFDTPKFFGPMIELIEASPLRRRRNAFMKSLSANWRGENPVRRYASMAALTEAALAGGVEAS